MNTARILIALLTALTVLFAGQATSSAQEGQIIFHGRDKATLTNAHSVRVCDEERDGHYVWAELRTGASEIAREADGGDPGCDTETFSLNYKEVLLCEENKGCTRWVPINVWG